MNDQTNQELDEVIHSNSEITDADILFKRGQESLRKGKPHDIIGNTGKVTEDKNKVKNIENQWEKIYNEGMEYYDSKNYEVAIQLFSEVIKLQPDNAKAYNYRGDSYSRDRNFPAAIIDLSRAIDISPSYYTAYNNRGYAYSRQGEYHQAINDFNIVIQQFLNRNVNVPQKDAVFAYTCRGFAYFRQNNFDLAIESCDLAIELNERYHTAYNYRGLIHIAQKRYDEAIQNHTSAIKIMPTHDLSYNFRGFAYAAKGEPERAIYDYDEAIELRAEKPHAWIYLNRGRAYHEMRKYEKAIADYDSAVRICHKYSEDLEDKNFEYWAQDAVNQAIELLERVIRSKEKRNTLADFVRLLERVIRSKEKRNTLADFVRWVKNGFKVTIESVIRSKKKYTTQNTSESTRTIMNNSQGAGPFRFQDECVYFQNPEALYYYGVLCLLIDWPHIAWRAFNDALKLLDEPQDAVIHHLEKDDVLRHLNNLREGESIYLNDTRAYYNSKVLCRVGRRPNRNQANLL